MNDVIKLTLVSSPAGDALVGSCGPYYLGESYAFRPGAAFTQALRDFNLKTARAPGDWPTTGVFASGPVRV